MKKNLVYIFIICLLISTGCSENSSNITERTNNSNFDIEILKNTVTDDNFACSPISIKSMLKVLEDSTEGDSQKQITSQLSNFTYPNIINDENIASTNGLFIKDSFQSNIKSAYTDMIKEKYNSDLIIDSFSSPDLINNWVSDNTFNMINNAFDDIADKDFILVNTLAIDLNWKNNLKKSFYFHPVHTKYDSHIEVYDYEGGGAKAIDFENIEDLVNGLDFACIANKYDLLNEIGEDNIKNTVFKEYSNWYDSYEYIDEYTLTPEEYVDQYIEDIKIDKTGFGFFGSSTDFSYYVDNDVKVFSKDLEEHNGINLSYIAVLPKNEDLKSFCASLSTNDVFDYISKLVTPKYETFDNGYVTKIHGYMPEFDFGSSLDLKKYLSNVNITDIFDLSRANFAPITDSNLCISDFSNKIQISLSNEGIKAASMVYAGGLGAAGPEFDYLYDLPYIDIDLEFNKPFIFFIIIKDTNDIWFEGCVVKPTIYR